MFEWRPEDISLDELRKQVDNFNWATNRRTGQQESTQGVSQSVLKRIAIAFGDSPTTSIQRRD